MVSIATARSYVPKPEPLTLRATSRYVPALDGLRGIAILLVVAAHYGFAHVIPGGFGVAIFFFISGFLIARLLLNEHETHQHISFRNFYLRRFFRLAPALYLFVFINSVEECFQAGHVDWPRISAALLYYFNYFNVFAQGADEKWGFLWSLAIEEHYYLIYPVAFAAAMRHGAGRLIMLLAGVTIAAAAWRWLLHAWSALPPDYFYMATDCRLDAIAYGAFLAALCHFRRDSHLMRFLSSRISLIAGLSLFLAGFLYRDESFRETARYTLQGLGFLCALSYSFFNPEAHFIRRMFSAQPLIYIGKISYSLYLWHLYALMHVVPHFGNTLNKISVPLSLLLGLMLAMASYHLVEARFSALRHRFGSTVRGSAVSGKALKPHNALMNEP